MVDRLYRSIPRLFLLVGSSPMLRDRGCYMLHFPDGSVYIGASFSLNLRVAKHRRRLRAGVHVNKKLQAAWDVTAGNGVIVSCVYANVLTVEELCEMEVRMIRDWIAKLGRNKVLNQCVASSPGSFTAFAKRQKRSSPCSSVTRVEGKGNGRDIGKERNGGVSES